MPAVCRCEYVCALCVCEERVSLQYSKCFRGFPLQCLTHISGFYLFIFFLCVKRVSVNWISLSLHLCLCDNSQSSSRSDLNVNTEHFKRDSFAVRFHHFWMARHRTRHKSNSRCWRCHYRDGWRLSTSSEYTESKLERMSRNKSISLDNCSTETHLTWRSRTHKMWSATRIHQISTLNDTLAHSMCEVSGISHWAGPDNGAVVILDNSNLILFHFINILCR